MFCITPQMEAQFRENVRQHYALWRRFSEPAYNIELLRQIYGKPQKKNKRRAKCLTA